MPINANGAFSKNRGQIIGNTGRAFDGTKKSCQGTFFQGKTGFKLKVQNCLSARMVIRARLERATYCLEGSCSIQLSYRTTIRCETIQ